MIVFLEKLMKTKVSQMSTLINSCESAIIGMGFIPLKQKIIAYYCRIFLTLKFKGRGIC